MNEDYDKIVASFKYVFASPEGKNVMDYLESFCCYNSTTINKKYNVLINEGRRQVILEIKQIIKQELNKGD